MNSIALQTTTEASLSAGEGFIYGVIFAAVGAYILYRNRSNLVCHNCDLYFPHTEKCCSQCGEELEINERPRHIERVAEWLPTIGQGPSHDGDKQ